MTDDYATNALSGRAVKWESVADTFDKNHGKSAKVYVHNRKVRSSFLIHHSAQDVSYDLQEFVERNIDKIPDEYEDAMIKEADELVQCIY